MLREPTQTCMETVGSPTFRRAAVSPIEVSLITQSCGGRTSDLAHFRFDHLSQVSSKESFKEIAYEAFTPGTASETRIFG